VPHGQKLPLERAEGRLAVLRKDPRHRLALPALDLVVAVQQAEAQPLRHGAADGCLAGAMKPTR